MALGEESSATVFKYLQEEEIERVVEFQNDRLERMLPAGMTLNTASRSSSNRSHAASANAPST